MSSATPKVALAAVFLIGAVASPQNILLVMLSVMALAAIWWNALASPFRTILATYLSLQWLQASMAIWMAAAAGADLSKPEIVPLCEGCGAMSITATTPAAIALALTGLAAVALGAMACQPRLGPFKPDPFLRDLSPMRVLVGYLIFFALSRVTGPFVGGGLAQPLLALGAMRYVFAALLILIFVTSGRGRGMLLAVYLIEIAQGFMGFFSGFKSIFYLGTAILLTLLLRDRKRVLPVIVVSTACVIALGVFWTLIKPAYRAMLNEGSQQQVITIDMADRVKALGKASSGSKENGISGGLADLALRMSYTEYLGAVMDYVPLAREHTAGALWGEAIAFVLQPRILFPDKPPLQSDSERTMLYTGLTMGSDSMGTSISIGYVGESYIDAGVIGAVAICFLVGAGYGFAGRLLARSCRGDQALFASVVGATYNVVQQFEISNMKLFPGFIWALIIGLLFIRLLWPSLRTFCAVGGSGVPSAPAGRWRGAALRHPG